MTVAGLPHTGTEALIAGRDYVATDLATEAAPRLYRNGTAGSVSHRAIPMGHITPTSPSLVLFNATYGTVRDGVGVPVINGDVVRVEVTTPAVSGAYPMFVKLGNQVARFTLTAEYPHLVQEVTCGLDATGVGTGWSAGCQNQTGLGLGVNNTCSNLSGVEIYEQVSANPPARFYRAAVCVAR